MSGVMLGRSGTSDIADATVVAVAAEARSDIVTGDRDDISRLAAAAGVRLVIVDT